MKFIKVAVAKTEIEKTIARISLARPDVRNAFHPEMIEELIQIFTDLPNNSNLRVIHFSGEGKSFCAGGDLSWMKEMKSYTHEQNLKDSDRLFHMFEVMMNCPLPIITTAHGAAFGGALGLLACSDYVLCEAKTQLCFSEVKLGIAPAVISSFVLQKVSLGHVGPWMMSGQIFTSSQAKEMGLVHQVCDEASLQTQTEVALNWFLEAGPLAVKKTKNLIHKVAVPSSGLSWSERRQITSNLIAELRTGDEGQEGLASFLEKRKPRWRLS